MSQGHPITDILCGLSRARTVDSQGGLDQLANINKPIR